MSHQFSALAQTKLQHIIDLLVKGTSHDLPVDDKTVSVLAAIAADEGFRFPGKTVNVTKGGFKNAMTDAPIATLLQFLQWTGTVT